MSFFKPYKSKAKAFNYIPRHYDPRKEEREQRRLELTGRRADSQQTYRSGDLIRNQIDARRGSAKRSKKRSNIIYLIFALSAAILLIYNLYPRLVAVVAHGGFNQTQEVREVEEFNPYAPITIVPNDYEGE